MFYINVPTRGELAHEALDAENAVYLAQDRMLHEARPVRGYRRVLFDPQLYLAGLDAERCTTTCANLTSYPWFATPGSIEYESGGALGRRAYKGLMKQIAATNWTGRAPQPEEMPAVCR